MPSTTLQARISAFESRSTQSALSSSPSTSPKSPRSSTSSGESLIDAPLSTITAAALAPVPAFSTPSSQRQKHSPSPSPPILGRKTSLIDLHDWIIDDDPVLAAPPLNGAPTLKPKPVIVKRKSMNGLQDGKTPTQRAFNVKSPAPNGLLINLESPPRAKGRTTNGKPPPPLPPRKTASYTSLKSVASTSSSQSSGPGPNAPFLYPPRRDTLTVEPAHAYPPSPLNIDTRPPSRHTAGSSISSFHSVSLSSDTDPTTPNSLSNFIATYPGDHLSEADSVSLTESYEDVSTSSLASPATERNIAFDFEKARARRNNGVPPTLPQRPSSNSSGFSVPSSARSSMKSPPPIPPSRSSQAVRTTGIVTPRSIPSSPITTGNGSNYNAPIPTTYAVRRPPPAPPSRASDRSSVQSTFSISSASNQSHRSLSRAGTITSISSTNSSPKVMRTQRPTPVPAAARKRYEAVFNGNVIQRRRAEKMQRKLALMKLQGGETKNSKGLLNPNEYRGRRAAGWRGLSVDLITGDPDNVANLLDQQHKDKTSNDEEEEPVDETIGKDERLEGSIVKLVWKNAGLEKKRLAEIWNECDPMQTGSLDLDSFVKGMWRIDEELRRMQTQLLKSASSASLASLASKQSTSRPPSLLGGRGNGPISSYRPPRLLLR